MTKILTICDDAPPQEILRNHQHYAQRYGYEHIWVSNAFMECEHLRTAYKYNFLLQHLKASPDGGLVMLLDAHTAIFNAMPIDKAMARHDAFVCYGPESTDGSPSFPMKNLIILRNTAENRAKVHEILVALHGKLSAQDHHPNEFGCLEKFGVMPTNAQLNGLHVNVKWTIPNWFNALVFAVHLGMATSVDAANQIQYDRVHDYNLEAVLLKRINGHFIEGKPIMEMPNYSVISDEPVSHFNPEARIALVTLYTQHITSYARISEHNVKRYCDRHGYAYHVYRGIPAELDQNINGAWLKYYLLKNNIAQYDWIIWVDADVLFNNPAMKLDSLLDGRDMLFAKDLCAWPLNAGVMGFRNTPKNVELIDKVWQHIQQVSDKSEVYSEQGDQFHTIKVLLENHVALDENNVLDCLTINTPPQLSNSDTLLTHYVGWGDPYRSIYMAHDDAISTRRG